MEVIIEMKKFYTIIGQQHTSKANYEDVNKNRITQCVFPITAHILSVIEKGEVFELVAVDSFNSSDSHENMELLNKELMEYFGDSFTLSCVNAHFEHERKAQMQIFMRLYETFKENDEVYFDITFGLKPTPMTVFVSCNYAQKFIPGLKIRDVVYAHYIFGMDEDYVHPIVDITSLFLLNNLIETISKFEDKDPMQFLKNVFDVDE